MISARSPLLLMPLMLLLAACASPAAYPVDRGPGGIDPLRIPAEPVHLSGTFACTPHVDGGLPAITWPHIPFRQEGDRLTGLYTFKDNFGHQDSVVFSGTLAAGGARVVVTAVRKDGSSNFTATLSGRRDAMVGPMMSGTSQRPVRSCTLTLAGAK